MYMAICTLDIVSYKQNLTVSKEKKHEFGEIFTPFSLIHNMFDMLPKTAFSNPNTKWLDPGAGTGFFSMILFQKLNEGLKQHIPDIEKRHWYIINEMMYMVEIQPSNITKLRALFGTNANIIKADFQINDKRMDINWNCTRCNHYNTYEDVRLRPEHHHFIRLFCRDCHSRFDIINELFQKNNDESNPALLGGGSVFDQTPEREKEYLISESCRTKNYHPVAEVDHYGRILLDTPFEPYAHYDFAMSLLRMGSNQGAAMHLEQAINLMIINPSMAEIQEGFLGVVRAELKKIENAEPTCFVNLSNEPPPFRESRNTGGYVNKNEPDFPDFKSMNVSRLKIPIKNSNEYVTIHQ